MFMHFKNRLMKITNLNLLPQIHLFDQCFIDSKKSKNWVIFFVVLNQPNNVGQKKMHQRQLIQIAY